MFVLTLEQFHVVSFPHFLQGGGGGAFPGTLYFEQEYSVPGTKAGVEITGVNVAVEFTFIEAMVAKVGRLEITFESVTGAITESIVWVVTGTVAEEAAAGTSAGTEGAAEEFTGSGTAVNTGAGSDPATLEAWWRAARCRPRSLSDGPRWRGWGKDEFGKELEKEAPG